MSKIIKGIEYDIVYLDTNALSEIAKNYNFAGRNFFKYLMDIYPKKNFAYATSVFNLYELSKTIKHRENILTAFNKVPLLVLESFPRNICKNIKKEDDVLLVTGLKPKLNSDIEDVFKVIESDSNKSSIDKFKSNLNNEINLWNKEKNIKKTDLELFTESYKVYVPDEKQFEILFSCNNAKIFSFIKKYFIYNKKDNITQNSVIDTYNASMAPSVDIYVTEKTVASWLIFSKDKFEFMKNVKIIKISDFYDKGDNDD
mgnify:CR=1 FL=1